MATVSKTITLTGCQFDESDIDKLIAAMSGPANALKEELTARQANIDEELAPKRLRKRKSEIGEDWRRTTQLEQERRGIEYDLSRLPFEFNATNIWGEEFSFKSMSEVWEHIPKPELKSLEIKSQLLATGLPSVGLALNLESNSGYENRFRISGAVDVVKLVSANVQEIIERRTRWWLQAGNRWFVQLPVGLIVWVVVLLEIDFGLHRLLPSLGANTALFAVYAAIGVIVLLIVPPIRIVQMLTPVVSVSGWGRFESRRRTIRYGAGVITLSLLATLIWTLATAQATK